MAESSLAHARSGIYEIVNTVNGKRYIGSATSFRQRFAAHRSQLRRGKHHSRHLQAAWNKHGESVFQFNRLFACGADDLLEHEQAHIDRLEPAYNICLVAGNCRGVKWTDEQKQRIAATRKNDHMRGRRHSPETLTLMSLAKAGNTATKGKARAPDAVAKTAAAHRGMKRSAETRAKIAAKAVGRKRSPETIEKAAAKLRGRKLAPEHAAKLIGNKHAAGRTQTDEEKARRAAGMRAAWAAKRAAGIPWRPQSAE